MALPYLSRAVRCGDLDADGHPLICGREYAQRWLNPNLLHNGDFSDQSGGFAIGWDKSGTATVYTSALGYTGLCTGIVCSIAQDFVIEPDATRAAAMKCTPGQEYRLKGKTRPSAGQTVKLRFRLAFYSILGIQVGSITSESITNTDDTGWTTSYVDATAPSSAYTVKGWVENTTAQACDGFIDDMELFPVWEDETTQVFFFSYSGMTHTFEFDNYPWAPMPRTQDDPVTRLDVGDTVIERQTREVRRTIQLDYPHMHEDYANQLELFHRLSRAQRFSYYDDNGIEHDVCWSEPIMVSRWPGSEYCNVSVRLTEYL